MRGSLVAPSPGGPASGAALGRRTARLATAALIALGVACATSPLGRRQLQLFPEAQMQQMGAQAFQEIRQQTPAADDPALQAYVECVAEAITAVVPADQAPPSWEVVVFRDDTANAFALPGGKIGVHTGLLDVAENQHQLATVVAHEVAHVLAGHSNERVSTSYATQGALGVLSILAGQSAEKQRALALLGVGAQVGIVLPFSRTQESEADLLGLDLMARAGFDPRASVALWQNMARAGGAQPPEFLSTHPSHASRIDDLRERLPRALDFYDRAQGRPRCQRP